MNFNCSTNTLDSRKRHYGMLTGSSVTGAWSIQCIKYIAITLTRAVLTVQYFCLDSLSLRVVTL